MFDGLKKRQSLTTTERERLEKRRADLMRRHQAHVDSGITDTVWKSQIDEIDKILAGDDDDLEVNNHGE